jgi:hypothetical protein
MFDKRSTLMVLALLIAPFVLTGCGSDKTTSPVQYEDTVAPMAPTAWQPKADGSIAVLRWARNTETDLAGYNVYKYEPNPQNQNSYVVVNSEPTAKNSYAVAGLTSGVTYYFRSTAVDVSGNESGYSEVMSITIGTGDQSGGTTEYPDINEM